MRSCLLEYKKSVKKLSCIRSCLLVLARDWRAHHTRRRASPDARDPQSLRTHFRRLNFLKQKKRWYNNKIILLQKIAGTIRLALV